MESKFSIGIDFGTLSARGVLVDIETGEELTQSIFNYGDAVIDHSLPETDINLPMDYALQNPKDYQDSLLAILSELWRKAKIKPQQVIGVGTDFTACTMIPLDKNLIPLCFNPNYRSNIHSWAKLWKHHGAQEEANLINQVATSQNEKFISRYGGSSSSEWLFAKILEVLNKAPEIYEATYQFMEAADWVVYLLTGEVKKNSVSAGFKAFWSADEGYPSPGFFARLHPQMKNVIAEKISEEVYPIGGRAGSLTKEMARATGLNEGIGVAFGNIDAHVSFPAVGAAEEGTMLMIMGTSLCHIFIDSKEILLKGISGVVKHGVLPGYYGYEAGQAAVGDIYDWFINKVILDKNKEETDNLDTDVFDTMNKKIANIPPGASGLLALDWWNGNRSPLVDADLSGLILGMSLTTTPAEIYKALIEATAFGSRIIIESCEEQGLHINHIFACGGLAAKSTEVMQIFADILGKEIKISGISQTSAFGSAMFGAVAAGKKNGGYDDIFQAIRKMPKQSTKTFLPNPKYSQTYNQLYEEYKTLFNYFGLGDNDVMKVLKRIKKQIHV